MTFDSVEEKKNFIREKPTLFGVEVSTLPELKQYLLLLAGGDATQEDNKKWRGMVEACAQAIRELQSKGRVPGLLEVHGQCGNAPSPEAGYVRCWPRLYGDTPDDYMTRWEGASKFHYWPPEKPLVKRRP